MKQQHIATHKTSRTTQIKIQCRDEQGNVLEHRNDILHMKEAIEIKQHWENKYPNQYMISIHFITK